MKIFIQTHSGRTIRLRVWNRLLLNGAAAHVLAHTLCGESKPTQSQPGGRPSGAGSRLASKRGRPKPDLAKRRERRETARLFRRFFQTARSSAAAARGAGDPPLVEVKSQNGVQVTVVL